MNHRRTVLEVSIVAVTTVIIVAIFLLVSEPWAAHPPRFADPSTYPKPAVVSQH
ncbi:hypothetical protein [Jatrophihabitans sp.]|uniref:hypothetical protein n=1 Tax=Jatrophihabitans sp. TaxID=1932789 RepID=UPI0030C78133|nr:hypothetical protein [Jatrophihabitans sp.]